MNKPRQSGIELLKIFAILMIILAHSVQTFTNFIDIHSPSSNYRNVLMNLMLYGGQLGNDIFLVCSSFFLLKSSRAKPEKAVNLLLDSQSISILMFLLVTGVAAALSLPLNTQNSLRFYVSQAFPNLFVQVWFVPAYVILYLIHPALNLIIKSINHKIHLCICVVILIIYGLFGYVNDTPFYSQLLAVISIYLCSGYVFTYCSNFCEKLKKNIYFTLGTILAFIIVYVLNNYAGLRFGHQIKYANFSRMLSIFNLCFAIGSFNCFRHLKFKNRIINYISSLTLFIYCIHQNRLIVLHIRPLFVEKTIGFFNNNFLVCSLILFAVVAVVSFILAVIYKETVHRLTAKLSVKIKDFVSKILDKLVAFNNKREN